MREQSETPGASLAGEYRTNIIAIGASYQRFSMGPALKQAKKQPRAALRTNEEYLI